MSRISDNLREARTSRGLTIRDIGRMVDAAESQISKWELGHVTPGPNVLRRYVDAGLMTSDEALGFPEAPAATGGEAA